MSSKHKFSVVIYLHDLQIAGKVWHFTQSFLIEYKR